MISSSLISHSFAKIAFNIEAESCFNSQLQSDRVPPRVQWPAVQILSRQSVDYPSLISHTEPAEGWQETLWRNLVPRSLCSAARDERPELNARHKTGYAKSINLTLHLVDTEGAARCKSVHNRTGRNCSEHLGQDVANTSEDADLGADQQAQSHCWVQVCAADVAQSLRQRGDGQREGQRDL